MKLIEKKTRVERYVKNWRPAPLLNAETKTLSKGFSNKLKAALSTIIYSQQTAYVKNRFLGESTLHLLMISNFHYVVSVWLILKGF